MLTFLIGQIKQIPDCAFDHRAITKLFLYKGLLMIDWVGVVAIVALEAQLLRPEIVG